MVSPAVIAGFATIDATLIGQLMYAMHDYQKHHEHGRDTHLPER
jgi:hypothetical protein